MPYDRDEVLARTDLAALADELLGPHRGRGTSASWPCPEPRHGSQTGRTPPVTVFKAPSGDERWRCHACSTGGTAADMVMVTQGVGFREAIEALARRAGVVERDDLRDRPLRRARIERPTTISPSAGSPEVERHVAACEAYLWSPGGAPMRRWLAKRGLGEEVLRVNRVGGDPGPQTLDRVKGLPRAGPAVVLPVLGPGGQASYLQARYLRPPGGRKYDNPAAALVGPSPRVADARLPGPALDEGIVLVCEGLPDALTAVQAGYRATAVLGAGLPDDRVGAALVRRFPTERLLVAFDADDRGRAGSERLLDLLGEIGAGERVGTVEVPGAWGDLNGWQLASGPQFGEELALAVEGAIDPPSAIANEQRGPPAQGLREMLETIQYEHLLVDNPALAARNLARLQEVVEHWEQPDMTPTVLDSRPATELDQRLELLAYEHLLVDNPAEALGNLHLVEDAVAEWSADLGRGAVRKDNWLVLANPTRGADVAPTSIEALSVPAPDRGLAIDF